MTKSKMVELVATVLRKKHPHLNEVRVIHIAYLILQTIQKEPTLIEVVKNGA